MLIRTNFLNHPILTKFQQPYPIIRFLCTIMPLLEFLRLTRIIKSVCISFYYKMQLIIIRA